MNVIVLTNDTRGIKSGIYAGKYQDKIIFLVDGKEDEKRKLKIVTFENKEVAIEMIEKINSETAGLKLEVKTLEKKPETDISN